MATVVKDFKVKAGLVVEGTTATVNNYDVLTKSQASQDYIVGIIGGETLITSVDSAQLEVVEGELFVIAETFDAFGSADTAESNAIAAAELDATTKANAAEDAANSYTDGRETAITSAYQSYADTAESDAIASSNSYTDGRETAITTAYQSYADQAEADAISASASDATTKANTAEANAESYTDSLIGDVTVDGTTGNTVKDRIDSAVAGLVDGAPEVLDTLNELAAALGDNPDVIADLQGVAAGKQNILTAGTSINITGDVISVVSSDFDAAGSADTAEANAKAHSDTTSVAKSGDTMTGALEMSNNKITGVATPTLDADATNKLYVDGSLTDLETTLTTAFESYTNSATEDLATVTYVDDQDTAAIAAAATYTDVEVDLVRDDIAALTTDDIEEGSNLYFTDARAVTALEAVVPNFTEIDIYSVATQVAATSTVATASQAVAYTFDGGTYRSAKFLVKVAYGTHTEVSEVLITLDTSDNIAITEYAIVGTNGSASTISAGMDGTNVQLLVTTVNNNSTVTVMGTLLA